MPAPVIAIANLGKDNPLWVEQLQNILGSTYDIDLYRERTHYVSRLTDRLTALLTVLADDNNWLFWTATPKSSPATRRIPIFLISEQPQPSALTSGVDIVLTPNALIKDLPQWITSFARVLDSEYIEKMDCDCNETLPSQALEGVEKFNAGEFYKQHDLFEALWVATDRPVRDLYRAILQVGIAYYQILRGNHRGARKMLMRSVQWLAILPDVCQGIDVKALREDSYRVRAALENLREDEINQFDRNLLQPVKFTSLGDQ